MRMSSFAFERGIAEKEGDIWGGGRKLKRSPSVTTLEYIFLQEFFTSEK